MVDYKVKINIYSGGHRDMLVSTFWGDLDSKGHYNLIGKNSSESDEKAYVVFCSDENYQLEVDKEILSVDLQYSRISEVNLLIEDSTKENLGWVLDYDLSLLAQDMTDSDIKLLKQ